MEFDKAKLEWLEYELLEHYPHVLHGTFSRHGGMSAGRFGTLNLGNATADHVETVKANREVVRKALGLPRLMFPHQQHGVIVHRVNGKNGDHPIHADALYTTEKNVGLGVTHADCQAAIFYDPVHEAVAVAHAGWRGSAQNIYARVVETLQREIGTQPHNLIVCISPSLGPDHAEFKNYKQELPKEFWDFQTKPLYFDFWAISKMQLTKCGILEKNIEIAGLCTTCNTNDYYSHRADKDTGRNATVVALKS
ncbi:MAG: peptidoglycan editing factor PgeF [Verrucomicrobiota bacterium]|nr:peptidoglycan editing factor PgeF [Verrucomicrobiota bacterium]